MSSDERAAPQAPPRTEEAGGAEGLGRRQFLTRVGGGLVTAALGVPAAMAVRSCVPNALYEKPLRFKAGAVASFAGGPTFISDQRVFVFRQGETFHSISAVCTHLGCTVQLVRQAAAGTAAGYEFHCPCHGSKYRADGTPYAGPAPRPLDHFQLAIAPDDGELVVDLSERVDKVWRLTV
jgi:cytochrome b6-f complex iron-sulfur subunit